MTNENESQYVVCRNGVFLLPDAVVKSLQPYVRNGFVYVRQDDDALTISTSRITDGHRRVLQPRYRVPMFRDARKLAIVDLKDSIRVMQVS
jgi:hypothetical protein